MSNMEFANIVSQIGSPIYNDSNIAIFNMDCIDGLEKIPDGSINLTVTSPPYNIGKEYENILSTSEYISWCEKWMNLVFNKTVDNGAFLLNVGYIPLENKAKALPLPYLLWDKTDFFLIQEIVWNYGAGVAGKTFLSPRNEKILWYVKDKLNYVFNLDDIRDPDVKYPYQKKNGKLRCNTIGKNPSDVWQIAKVTSGANRSSEERTPHPAQFPVDLIERVIKGFSNNNDLVVDPFIGSGTTAEVCLLNGRKVIGFEINQKYCHIIIDRLNSLKKKINAEKMQMSLF